MSDDERDCKRAKLADEKLAPKTSCRCNTLEEALLAAHTSCLQSHVAAETPDSTFDNYIVWLHAESRSVSCTDCLTVLPLSWMQRSCSPWSWWSDLEALIRANCSSCLSFLFRSLDSHQQQRFLEQAARTVVREGGVLVIYSIADSFQRRLFVQKKVFDEAICAHFAPARKQQSVTAPVIEGQHFHCVVVES
jgi:hypothetical protein